MSPAAEKCLEVKLLPSSLLTEEIIRQVDHLSMPPHLPIPGMRLIDIYHTYIIHEHEALAINFNDMARNLYMLIDFFRMVEKEVQPSEQHQVSKRH